jgi:short-subunit dehydrogenase
VGELLLITGASSGTGLSTAVECAAAGHRVIATMRTLARRKDLEKAAAERGVRVEVEQLDVTSEAAPAKVRELVLKYGPFYGLVNSAGIAAASPFEEQADASVRELFETNVFGLMTVTRAVLPAMRAAGRGRIVNVSCLSGRVALPGLSVYSASKHAVEGFSEALRWELAPLGLDVLVVASGTLRAPLWSRVRAAARAEGPYAALSATVEDLTVAGAERAPEPAEVGQAIARLLVDPSPPFRTLVGRDAQAIAALRRVMPDRLFATGLRRLIRSPNAR